MAVDTAHYESLGYMIYDWTVSLCGLVVSMLHWQLRGIGFDPHQGLYTFQS